MDAKRRDRRDPTISFFETRNTQVCRGVHLARGGSVGVSELSGLSVKDYQLEDRESLSIIGRFMGPQRERS